MMWADLLTSVLQQENPNSQIQTSHDMLSAKIIHVFRLKKHTQNVYTPLYFI